MNELISVIVPIYNAEMYLRECLNSIVGQTYTNLEIILVNDGSTDNSANICMEYVKTDKRIIYIEQENQGVSSARNNGLKKISGEYFIFADSDDIQDIKLIEILYRGLNKNNSDISVCRYTKVDDNERKDINLSPDKLELSIEKILDSSINCKSHEAVIRLVQDGKYSGYTWNKLFKTKILKDELGKFNMYFEKNIHMCEDLLFCVEYISHIDNVIFIEYPLYYYYENSKGITKGGFSEKLFTQVYAYEKMLKIFANGDESTKKVNEAILRAYLIGTISHYSMMISDGYTNVNMEKEYKRIIKDNYDRTQRDDINKRDKILAKLIKNLPSKIYRIIYSVHKKV